MNKLGNKISAITVKKTKSMDIVSLGRFMDVRVAMLAEIVFKDCPALKNILKEQ